MAIVCAIATTALCVLELVPHGPAILALVAIAVPTNAGKVIDVFRRLGGK